MSNAHDEENCVNCGDRRTSDATPTDGVHATCRLCGAVRASRELSTGWVCLDFAACDAKRRSETATTDRNGETEAEFYRKRYLEAHTELERLRRPTATETCDDELNTIEKCRGLVSRAVSVQAAFEALTVLAVQARYRREQRRESDPIRDRLIRLEGAAGFVVRRIELATSDSLRERIEALKAVLDSEDP
jgi:hypothetical protein